MHTKSLEKWAFCRKLLRNCAFETKSSRNRIFQTKSFEKSSIPDKSCWENEHSRTNRLGIPPLIFQTLLSSCSDMMLQLSMESRILDDFLRACSTDVWFRQCAVILRSPTVERNITEKLSIVLQKLSKIKYVKETCSYTRVSFIWVSYIRVRLYSALKWQEGWPSVLGATIFDEKWMEKNLQKSC